MRWVRGGRGGGCLASNEYLFIESDHVHHRAAARGEGISQHDDGVTEVITAGLTTTLY